MDKSIESVRQLVQLGFPRDEAMAVVQRENDRERERERERNQHELEMARLKSQSKPKGMPSYSLSRSRSFVMDATFPDLRFVDDTLFEQA